MWKSSITTGFIFLMFMTCWTSACKPQASYQSLKAELAGRVGAGLPVAVFVGEGELFAISADGRFRMSLVEGATEWGLVDSHADVIWYGKRGKTGELWALDLAAPSSSHVQIATDLPVDTVVGIEHLQGSDPNNRLMRGAAVYNDEVILKLDGEAPRFEFSAGLQSYIEEVPEQEIRALIRAIQFTPQGKAFLWKLGARKTGRTANLVPTDPPAEKRLRTVPTEPCAEDRDMCGRVEGLPGTRYWRVMVGYSCGDGCYPEYQFYDPDSKQFVDLASAGVRSIRPLPGGSAINEMWISPDGQWFLREGAIHRFEQKASRTGLGSPAGWLGGQWHVY